MTRIPGAFDRDTPAFPDFPPLGAEALADADRLQAGRWLLVGEEYDLGPTPDWTVNPSHDKEWQIAQHKHYWAVHLVYAATVRSEPAYLTTWSRLLDSWLTGMGSGHIVQSDAQVEAKRIESWVWARSLLTASPWQDTVDPALLDRVTARLGQEAAYVAAHLKPVRNHRTFELYAVALASVLFPVGDGTLEELAIRELTANLLSDLGPDGVHIEMSTHYHQLVAETAVGLLELCSRNGIPLPGVLQERVHRALRWSLWLQWPDADIPLLNDSDTGDHRDLLRRGSALFDDAELLFGATLGAAGRPPAAPTRLFPSSGYLVLSDGWGHDAETHASRQHVVLDTASLGEGSHSHYDLLSFTWYAAGGPAVVDPGRFTYSADPDADGQDWRHHFKSTAAHNTVTVDGLDQTRYISRNKHGPEAVLQDVRHHVGGHTDWAVGTVRSREYAPRHRRTLVFPNREYLLVLDRLTGQDGSEHDYDLRLHLPDARAELRKDGDVVRVSTPRCVIRTGAPAGARTELQCDWVSRHYGVKTEAAVLSTQITAVDVDLVTVLASRTGPDVRLLERTVVPGGLAVRVSGVHHGRQFEDVLLVADATTPVAAHGLTATGRWCLVRRDGTGRPELAVGEAISDLRVDGSRLDGATGVTPEWSP